MGGGTVRELPLISDDRLSIELAEALNDHAGNGTRMSPARLEERSGLKWNTVYSYMRRRFDGLKPRVPGGAIMLTLFAALGTTFTNRIMRLAGYRVIPLDCGTATDTHEVMAGMSACVAEIAMRAKDGIDRDEAGELLPDAEETLAEFTVFVEQLRAKAS